jgi:hypothetical protein
MVAPNSSCDMGIETCRLPTGGNWRAWNLTMLTLPACIAALNGC